MISQVPKIFLLYRPFSKSLVFVLILIFVGCRSLQSPDTLENPPANEENRFAAPTQTESNALSTPSPISGQIITDADEAVSAIKAHFPEVSEIEASDPTTIGISQDIYIHPIDPGWKIIFWQGSGDCPSGCLNDHYWYFSVKKNGEISLSGEFERIFDPFSGDYIITGEPLWGIPY
jgi:hypothetical protein